MSKESVVVEVKLNLDTVIVRKAAVETGKCNESDITCESVDVDVLGETPTSGFAKTLGDPETKSNLNILIISNIDVDRTDEV